MMALHMCDTQQTPVRFAPCLTLLARSSALRAALTQKFPHSFFRRIYRSANWSLYEFLCPYGSVSIRLELDLVILAFPDKTT